MCTGFQWRLVVSLRSCPCADGPDLWCRVLGGVFGRRTRGTREKKTLEGHEDQALVLFLRGKAKKSDRSRGSRSKSLAGLKLKGELTVVYLWNQFCYTSIK